MTTAPPREELKPARDHQGRSPEKEGMGACLTIVEKPHPAQQTVCVRVCVCVRACVYARVRARVCVCVCPGHRCYVTCAAGTSGSHHIPVPREAFQGAMPHHLSRQHSGQGPERRNKSAAQSRGHSPSSPSSSPRSPPPSQLLAPSSKHCSYKQLTQILSLN